jgi:ABC-2 type transport system permease protein
MNFLRRWKTLFIFEIKSMRLFGMQILISMVILPFILLLLLLLQPGSHTLNQKTVLITGYIVASLLGVYLNVYAITVANLMLPEVLELYAVLPIRRREVIGAGAAIHTFLVLPQVIIASGILLGHYPLVAMLNFVVSLLWVMFSLVIWAVWLGLRIRYYVAMGVLPFISWVMLLITPIYYDVAVMPGWAFVASMLNPLFHYVLILRQPLQVSNFPIGLSWGISLLFVGILLIGIRQRIKEMYILETL